MSIVGARPFPRANCTSIAFTDSVGAAIAAAVIAASDHPALRSRSTIGGNATNGVAGFGVRPSQTARATARASGDGFGLSARARADGAGGETSGMDKDVMMGVTTVSPLG